MATIKEIQQRLELVTDLADPLPPLLKKNQTTQSPTPNAAESP